MVRGKVAAALAGVATAVVLAFTAQPASAADAHYTATNAYCNAGYACAWQYTNGEGTGVGFYSDSWDWSSIGSYSWINNNSASWSDHGLSSYGNVRFFQNAGGTGINRCLNKGYAEQEDSGIAYMISANVWVSSCSGYTQFSGQIQLY